MLVGGGAAGMWASVSSRPPALPGAEVDAYLKAWEGFDVAGMSSLVDRPPPDLATAVTAMKDDLQVTGARFRRVGVRREPGRDTAVAEIAADVDLAGLGTWAYKNTLELHRVTGKWRVAWTPTALHPSLHAGQRFDRTRSWPVRAPILAADGNPLVSTTDVVLVGLEPDRIKDRAAVEAVLKAQVGAEPAAVEAVLAAPGVKPDHFVEVARIRPDRFAQVRPVLDPVPGVFFQRSGGRLAVAENFAAHVLGRFAEVMAERLADLGPPYLVGDKVGLSGLEANFERKLAGTPSGEVRIVDAVTNTVVETVDRFTGTQPEPVRTTLDRRAQEAAEAALAGVTQPAAIVAVDAASGDVRAVVSRPLNEPFNRALAGQYPPGSTFKVVTAAALLGAGTRPETAAPCPATATIGGQTFRNFEGEALGTTTFRTAFAQSCNTAFVALAATLSNSALGHAAANFGFGAPYDLGVLTAGAAFPEPKDVAERASAAIGQGRVVASPVQMATVAGAVASGAVG